MFVLRLLISVNKNIFGMINKRGPNKHWGEGLEKNSKINKREEGRLFGTHE